MHLELNLELADKGVLHITMNRPELHNAFDDKQIARLTDALRDAATNDAVRVVVLASHGKSFSAGGDINYMRRMGSNSYDDNLADAGRLATLMKTLNTLPKPTIARVQGAAMGGGVGLVCCCDYAIGSNRAVFALSEVKLGMVPATIGPYVVNTIGEKAARRLFMSGERVQADGAKALGFLSEVVEESELDHSIAELVDTLVQNAPNAIRIAKQLVRDIARRELNDDTIEQTVRLIADIRDSDEGREGLSAFLDKRPPKWQLS